MAVHQHERHTEHTKVLYAVHNKKHLVKNAT